MSKTSTAAARERLAKMRVAIQSAMWQSVAVGAKAAESAIIGTKTYQNKTGETRASVKVVISGFGAMITAGGKTRFLTNGTAPHRIMPVNGKFLKFKMNGADVFSRGVMHPGTKALGFMEAARVIGYEVARETASALLNAITYR